MGGKKEIKKQFCKLKCGAAAGAHSRGLGAVITAQKVKTGSL